MLAIYSDINLQEIGTKQARQIMQASLAVATYAVENPHVRKLFYISLSAGQSYVAFINADQFLQAVFCSARQEVVCFVGYHNLIRSRDRHIFRQYSNTRAKRSNKSTEVLPSIVAGDAHWIYCAEDLEGVGSFCRGCWSCPPCTICFLSTFCQILKRNELSYWARWTKDFDFMISRTIYCVERALYRTRLMKTMRCRTYLARWTLHFDSSPSSILIASLWLFLTTQLTHCSKVGPSLHSTNCKHINCLQRFICFCLQWQLRLA